MNESPHPNLSVRRWPAWAKALAGVAAVLLVMGLLAPYLINLDRYRATVAGAITRQTGRQVTLGKISVRVFPYVGFDVARFHMGNPDGFVAGEFLSAQRVRGKVAFWPLVLRHEFRISSLELSQPKLVLLGNYRHQNNFTFPASPAAAQPTSSVLQIEEVVLRDAEVVYGRVDELGHATAIVDSSGFTATLRHLLLQPLSVNAWQADGNLAGAQMALASWSGPISFRTGTVTLRSGDLEANFAADFGKAARADGTLSVADVERAMVRFDLKIADMDVDALQSGFQAAGQNDNPLPKPPPSGDSNPIPGTNGASRLLAQGHLAAERIRWAPYIAGPATADLRLYADRMEIWPITVRFESGSLQASARTDSRQRPERFSVNLEARNLNVEHMLSSTPWLRGKVAGTGELDLQAFGSVGAAWKNSLTGKGEFAIRNGRISGFSLAGAAQASADLPAANGDTTFVAITGDLDVVDQRVTSRNLHLDSPRGTMDLQGSSGLDGSLDYDGRIIVYPGAQPGAEQTAATNPRQDARNLAPSKNAVSLTLPFALRGTLQEPQFVPGRPGEKSFTPNAPQPGEKRPSFPNLFQK